MFNGGSCSILKVKEYLECKLEAENHFASDEFDLVRLFFNFAAVLYNVL